MVFDMDQSNRYNNLVKERDELRERVKKLFEFLTLYFDGKLDHEPRCTYNLLHEQYVYMKRYLDILEYRVEYEKTVDSDN